MSIDFREQHSLTEMPPLPCWMWEKERKMNLVEGAVQKKVDETLEMSEFDPNNEEKRKMIWNVLLKKISLMFPTIGNKD